MGDSPCVVQDSSRAPENSTDDETKVSPVSAALGGSVSFGRFLSESLDWGKWSSFCQKRHLEEVKKYSTPGSVAQKKAYFEAHYRKAAARKSAALLEQATPSANNADLETERSNGVESNDEYNANSLNVIPEYQESNLSKGDCGLEIDQLQKCVIIDHSSQIESPGVADNVENQYKVNGMELVTSPLEKQPLKENSLLNQEDKDSIEKRPRIPTKPGVIPRPPGLPTSLASKLHSSVKSVPCLPQNKSTPNSKKHGTESSEKKKSTLGSLHLSVNFSQDRKGETTPMMNKPSPNLKKVEEVKVVRTLRGIQGCSNHLITPSRASSNGVMKCAPINPKSEHGRERTILDQRLSGREKVDARSCRDSVDYSKSLDVRRNQFQAQTLSPSLGLRTAERMEKQKKFSHNLEDKFRGKEAKKLQVQEIAKEKSENEIKKLRQSLSFKARPLPAFYHRTKAPKVEVKKVQLARSQSPKPGRTSKSEANSVPKFLPPPQPSSSSIKGNRSTCTREKSGPALRSSIAMKPKNHNADSVSSSNS